jgi:N-acetylmuramoyl-L-alanine amidase
LLLSIHINSFFHPYATGTETYYYKPSDKPLAFYIHQEMTKTLGFRDNGLKRARLYVLRNTRMPAMLVEPGFITNPMEYEKMAEPETRQKIAKAVTDGTIRYMEKYGAK